MYDAGPSVLCVMMVSHLLAVLNLAPALRRLYYSIPSRRLSRSKRHYESFAFNLHIDNDFMYRLASIAMRILGDIIPLES